jgi:hypothetical protein
MSSWKGRLLEICKCPFILWSYLVGLYCPDAVVQPTVSFDLSEGPKVVARATVLSVLETTVPE